MPPTESIVLALAFTSLPLAIASWLLRCRTLFIFGLIGTFFGQYLAPAVMAEFAEPNRRDIILTFTFLTMEGTLPGAAVGAFIGWFVGGMGDWMIRDD
jgi:hypothetical protein